MKNRKIVLLLLFCLLTIQTLGAVWQWSVPVRNARESTGDARAYLWIPEHCKLIKGVVIAQSNMEEISILENPLFRKNLSHLGFAEIWVSPSFDHLFRFDQGSGETLDGILKDLGQISGYQELGHSLMIPMGHSAAASWPYYLAAWKPGRVIAALSISGQWPYFRSPVFAPDIWGKRNIDFVPMLESMGEYEAADSWSDEGLKEKRAHPLTPMSMIANPAQGHFATTIEKIKYLNLYINKAVKYRVSKKKGPRGPLLNPIDPTKTGWLVDRWRFDKHPAAQPAPVTEYAGNAGEAFWFFDRELAEATKTYQSAYFQKKTALIGFVQDGKVIQQRNTHQQVDLKFEPLPDGITFILHPVFLDSVPGESPRPAAWTNLPVGTRIGHAFVPIQINPITGPVARLNDTTFRLNLTKGMSGKETRYDLWFIATDRGDDDYKPAAQQAQMTLPAKISEGMDQHIEFLPLKNIRRTQKEITLSATSDAGLPVHFFVKSGPAEVLGNRLRFTRIPPKSKFPVKITVVAWQYGCKNAKITNTANPVAQSFDILK